MALQKEGSSEKTRGKRIKSFLEEGRNATIKENKRENKRKQARGTERVKERQREDEAVTVTYSLIIKARKLGYETEISK